MPTVKRFARCRIVIHCDEHPPPHFHVLTNDNEAAAVYLIETLELRDGDIRPRDAAEALAWAAENRAELYACWREYAEEES